MFEMADLLKMKVNELKGQLSKFGLNTKGNKIQLVERLAKFLNIDFDNLNASTAQSVEVVNQMTNTELKARKSKKSINIKGKTELKTLGKEPTAEDYTKACSRDLSVVLERIDPLVTGNPNSRGVTSSTSSSNVEALPEIASFLESPSFSSHLQSSANKNISSKSFSGVSALSVNQDTNMDRFSGLALPYNITASGHISSTELHSPEHLKHDEPSKGNCLGLGLNASASLSFHSSMFQNSVDDGRMMSFIESMQGLLINKGESVVQQRSSCMYDTPRGDKLFIPQTSNSYNMKPLDPLINTSDFHLSNDEYVYENASEPFEVTKFCTYSSAENLEMGFDKSDVNDSFSFGESLCHLTTGYQDPLLSYTDQNYKQFPDEIFESSCSDLVHTAGYSDSLNDSDNDPLIEIDEEFIEESIICEDEVTSFNELGSKTPLYSEPGDMNVKNKIDLLEDGDEPMFDEVPLESLEPDVLKTKSYEFKTNDLSDSFRDESLLSESQEAYSQHFHQIVDEAIPEKSSDTNEKEIGNSDNILRENVISASNHPGVEVGSPGIEVSNKSPKDLLETGQVEQLNEISLKAFEFGSDQTAVECISAACIEEFNVVDDVHQCSSEAENEVKVEDSSSMCNTLQIGSSKSNPMENLTPSLESSDQRSIEMSVKGDCLSSSNDEVQCISSDHIANLKSSLDDGLGVKCQGESVLDDAGSNQQNLDESRPIDDLIVLLDDDEIFDVESAQLLNEDEVKVASCDSGGPYKFNQDEVSSQDSVVLSNCLKGNAEESSNYVHDILDVPVEGDAENVTSHSICSKKFQDANKKVSEIELMDSHVHVQKILEERCTQPNETKGDDGNMEKINNEYFHDKNKSSLHEFKRPNNNTKTVNVESVVAAQNDPPEMSADDSYEILDDSMDMDLVVTLDWDLLENGEDSKRTSPFVSEIVTAALGDVSEGNSTGNLMIEEEGSKMEEQSLIPNKTHVVKDAEDSIERGLVDASHPPTSSSYCEEGQVDVFNEQIKVTFADGNTCETLSGTGCLADVNRFLMTDLKETELENNNIAQDCQSNKHLITLHHEDDTRRDCEDSLISCSCSTIKKSSTNIQLESSDKLSESDLDTTFHDVDCVRCRNGDVGNDLSRESNTCEVDISEKLEKLNSLDDIRGCGSFYVPKESDVEIHDTSVPDFVNEDVHWIKEDHMNVHAVNEYSDILNSGYDSQQTKELSLSHKELEADECDISQREYNSILGSDYSLKPEYEKKTAKSRTSNSCSDVLKSKVSLKWGKRKQTNWRSRLKSTSWAGSRIRYLWRSIKCMTRRPSKDRRKNKSRRRPICINGDNSNHNLTFSSHSTSVEKFCRHWKSVVKSRSNIGNCFDEKDNTLVNISQNRLGFKTAEILEKSPVDASSKKHELDVDAISEYFSSNYKGDVSLDSSTCDLNLQIGEDGTTCTPIVKEELACLWGNVKSNCGVRQGKMCFQIKVMEKLHVGDFPDGITPMHGIRVGFSFGFQLLHLGREAMTYAYDSCGNLSNQGTFNEGVEPFYPGDVITAYADLTGDPYVLSFSKNDVLLDSCIFIPPSSSHGLPIFPHVATRNCSFQANFTSEMQWFRPRNEFTMIGNLGDAYFENPKESFSLNGRDSKVLLMCGLPGSGKTHWVQNFLKENSSNEFFTVLGDSFIIKKMEVDGNKEIWVHLANKCIQRLLTYCFQIPRNYILDQTNVYKNARKKKLEYVSSFKCKFVVVVPSDAEYQRRCEERKRDGRSLPSTVLLEMKRNFRLPKKDDIVRYDVEFVEENEFEARQIVKEYNKQGKIHYIQCLKHKRLSNKSWKSSKASSKSFISCQDFDSESLMEHGVCLENFACPSNFIDFTKSDSTSEAVQQSITEPSEILSLCLPIPGQIHSSPEPTEVLTLPPEHCDVRCSTSCIAPELPPYSCSDGMLESPATSSVDVHASQKQCRDSSSSKTQTLSSAQSIVSTLCSMSNISFVSISKSSSTNIDYSAKASQETLSKVQAHSDPFKCENASWSASSAKTTTAWGSMASPGVLFPENFQQMMQYPPPSYYQAPSQGYYPYMSYTSYQHPYYAVQYHQYYGYQYPSQSLPTQSAQQSHQLNQQQQQQNGQQQTCLLPYQSISHFPTHQTECMAQCSQAPTIETTSSSQISYHSSIQPSVHQQSSSFSSTSTSAQYVYQQKVSSVKPVSDKSLTVMSQSIPFTKNSQESHAIQSEGSLHQTNWSNQFKSNQWKQPELSHPAQDMQPSSVHTQPPQQWQHQQGSQVLKAYGCSENNICRQLQNTSRDAKVAEFNTGQYVPSINLKKRGTDVEDSGTIAKKAKLLSQVPSNPTQLTASQFNFSSAPSSTIAANAYQNRPVVSLASTHLTSSFSPRPSAALATNNNCVNNSGKFLSDDNHCNYNRGASTIQAKNYQNFSGMTQRDSYNEPSYKAIQKVGVNNIRFPMKKALPLKADGGFLEKKRYPRDARFSADHRPFSSGGFYQSHHYSQDLRYQNAPRVPNSQRFRSSFRGNYMGDRYKNNQECANVQNFSEPRYASHSRQSSEPCFSRPHRQGSRPLMMDPFTKHEKHPEDRSGDGNLWY